MRNIQNRMRYFLNRDGIPITKGIAVLAGIVFISAELLKGISTTDPYGVILLRAREFFRVPWTLLTYPLANRDLFSLIFGVLWLWFVGGSLERSWGKQTYGLFITFATLVTGTCMILVDGLLLTGGVPISGLSLLLVSLTWAWGEYAGDQEVLLMGILPVKVRWLAWIGAILTFAAYYPAHLLLGIASLSGIAVVYLFRGRGPFSRGYRYWAWQHGVSPKNWWENWKEKRKRNRFKVVK